MEVEAVSLLWFLTRLHLGAFVGAVVIHDEVHFLIDRKLRF